MNPPDDSAPPSDWNGDHHDKTPVVERLSKDQEEAWDYYVRAHRNSSAFHLLGWKRVVESCFGHEPFYLIASLQESVVGVLPLFHLKSLLFGRSLVSLPYAIRGGVLADNRAAATALLARAEALAEDLRVDYLELRSEEAASDHLLTKDLYVTFKADLRQSEEELLKRMQRKRRQMMNYAHRMGYEGRAAGVEELPLFYRLFSMSMRSHGTPVAPYAFVREILTQYAGESNLYFVFDRDGQPLAGVLSLLCGETCLPFYAGTDRTNRRRGVDDFILWSLMLWAKSNNYGVFDLGRSRRDTGAYSFKTRWGMEETPLAYQYHLVRSSAIPNISPGNPRYGSLIRIWQRLPIPATRVLGASVFKRLP